MQPIQEASEGPPQPQEPKLSISERDSEIKPENKGEIPEKNKLSKPLNKLIWVASVKDCMETLVLL